jgi:hypothetical protein
VTQQVRQHTTWRPVEKDGALKSAVLGHGEEKPAIGPTAHRASGIPPDDAHRASGSPPDVRASYSQEKSLTMTEASAAPTCVECGATAEVRMSRRGNKHWGCPADGDDRHRGKAPWDLFPDAKRPA